MIKKTNNSTILTTFICLFNPTEKLNDVSHVNGNHLGTSEIRKIKDGDAQLKHRSETKADKKESLLGKLRQKFSRRGKVKTDGLEVGIAIFL